jgi:hypothetical protein
MSYLRKLVKQLSTKSRWFLTLVQLDTLLNVFLAIAVDNLANAQELTAAEEQAAELEAKVSKENSVNAGTVKSLIPSLYHYWNHWWSQSQP